MEVHTAVFGVIGSERTRDDVEFEAAFAAHHRRLFRVAFLLCGDAGRAEDAVAEAFARVYSKWRRGRVDDLGPYLRRAVVNQVRGRFRRISLERREAERQRGDDRGERALDDQTVERDAVRQALLALPARQRAAVVLRYYEDRSEAETAALLGVRVGTIKSQVSRGLERMREVLESGGGER